MVPYLVFNLGDEAPTYDRTLFNVVRPCGLRALPSQGGAAWR